MKTKHLFFATALVASFASCTNDDIAEIQQGVANVERPTVEDVRLNFVAEGVDSRLTFGSNGYAWEADDVIGALNMDQPNATVNTPETWSTKYDLTNFINTSYPFTYDAESGTWGTPGKMLEGNYFFAFPFTDYEGERYAKYSLIDQQQTGIKGAVVAKNYADNQVFVGYSPILKGTGFDILSDIEMTSLLGAVQLRIVNEGTKTYHINKIVINGTNVKSGFQLDPKTAAYTNYSTGLFNTANYLGKDFDGDKVAEAVLADIEDETFAAERMEALRAVADFNGAKNFVQLFVNGTEEERALAVDGTAYALVMVNPIQFFTIDEEGDFTTTPKAGCGTLTATIYTDEGIIENVNLLNTSDESVVTSGYVKSTKPGVANTVVINITDKMVKEATSLSVYTEEDLLQLISWNAGVAKKTTATATLKADIELTKEAIDLLKTNEKLTLKIRNEQNATKSLTLAADLAADVLSYEGLKVLTAQETVTEGTNTVKYDAVPVKVAGEINLVKESIKLASIEVLEDAVLNINVLNANVPATVTVAEGGTLNIGAAAKTSNTVTITNNGIVNVAAGALVQGAINNKAELNLNGTANNVANEGIVNLGATSKLMGGTNTYANNEDAVINMVSGATLTNINVGVTKAGRVKYVDGAIITHTGTGASKTSTVNSEVFVEVGGANVSVSADTYKNKGVNLWKLVGDINVTAGVTLGDVEVAKETTVVVTVAADSLLTISNLNVLEGAAITTNGKIKVTNLNVAKEGEWTNNGEAVVVTKLTNNGAIYNNGVAKAGSTAATTFVGSVNYKLESSSVSQTSGDATWSNNAFLQYYVPAKSAKRVAMDTLVEKWAGYWDEFMTQDNYIAAGYYKGNPYDYKALVKCLVVWTSDKEAMKTAGFTDAQLTIATDGTVSEPEEFAEAVAEYLDEDAEEAAEEALILPSTDDNAGQFTATAISMLSQNNIYVFEDAAEIDNYVATQFNTVANLTTLQLDYKEGAAIWDLTLTTATTSTKATKYFFVSEDDTIYTVARLWKKHSERITTGITNLYVKDNVGSKNTVANLQKFVNELSNIKSSERTEAQQEAYTAFAEYKEFILALPKTLPTYTQQQITACAEWNEDAERVNFQVVVAQ